MSSAVDKKRVAIVVQRCGTNIVAGAERYALNLALSLANAGVEVEVLTSRSSDYHVWNNKLDSEEFVESREGRSVHVRRYPVTTKKKRWVFAIVKRAVFFLNARFPFVYSLFSDFLDFIFLKTQGPWCPLLWEDLAARSGDFDLVIFKAYLYAPCYFGLKAICKATPSLFVVTAHDEAPFRLSFVKKELQYATHVGFVSQAEENLCRRCWPSTPPSLRLSPGVENLWKNEIEQVNCSVQVPEKYFLMVGRVDKGKNIEMVLRAKPSGVSLVLAGDVQMDPEQLGDAIVLGKVTETEKRKLLKNALALVVTSKNEAFSIITAEALCAGTLVLTVHGCLAVVELVLRYGGIVCAEEALGEQMKLILERHPSVLKKYPDIINARANLSWKKTCLQILDILERGR